MTVAVAALLILASLAFLFALLQLAAEKLGAAETFDPQGREQLGLTHPEKRGPAPHTRPGP